MKRRIAQFTGSRPVFTGSPSIVTGGFNLDVTNQSFEKGSVIPEGSLAIMDEAYRTVRIVKTAKVKAIDSNDAKKVSLTVGEFYEPMFVVGEKVLKAGAISGTYAGAPSINKVTRGEGVFDIELSSSINGLAAGDTLIQVVSAQSDVVVAGIEVTHGQSDHVYMVTPGLDLAANDKVMNYPLADGALIANAISVTSYDKLTGKLVLASDPSSAAVGDKIVKVFASGTSAVTSRAVAAEIGMANCVVVSDTNVGEYETSLDVCADTMQYALYERRVAPIPSSQKDATGSMLAGNPHVKLTQSM